MADTTKCPECGTLVTLTPHDPDRAQYNFTPTPQGAESPAPSEIEAAIELYGSACRDEAMAAETDCGDNGDFYEKQADKALENVRALIRRSSGSAKPTQEEI